MSNYTFEEISDLMESWKAAFEAGDDETMMHIENVLPDNIIPCI